MRRTYTMANTNPYTSTRICKDCGKVMTNVSNKSCTARKTASGTQRSGMQSSGQIAGQRMPQV